MAVCVLDYLPQKFYDHISKRSMLLPYINIFIDLTYTVMHASLFLKNVHSRNFKHLQTTQ